MTHLHVTKRSENRVFGYSLVQVLLLLQRCKKISEWWIWKDEQMTDKFDEPLNVAYTKSNQRTKICVRCVFRILKSIWTQGHIIIVVRKLCTLRIGDLLQTVIGILSCVILKPFCHSSYLITNSATQRHQWLAMMIWVRCASLPKAFMPAATVTRPHDDDQRHLIAVCHCRRAARTIRCLRPLFRPVCA